MGGRADGHLLPRPAAGADDGVAAASAVQCGRLCLSAFSKTRAGSRDWHTIFPNASSAVGLIDRLTHHSAMVKVTGESYRLREAERAQNARRTSAK